MIRSKSKQFGVTKPPVQRTRRVLLALGILWSLSMLDLALTIGTMHGPGMIELNPLARAIVHTDGSTATLAAWKVLCTLLATIILVSLRRKWTAEVASWVCVAALAYTTVSWVRYLECDDVQLLSAAAMSDPPDAWVWVSR